MVFEVFREFMKQRKISGTFFKFKVWRKSSLFLEFDFFFCSRKCTWGFLFVQTAHCQTFPEIINELNIFAEDFIKIKMALI